jgi:hypothetical protein
MLTQKIKNLINEMFDSTPSNVGVGYGFKKVNGKFSNEKSIVFFVPEKKPLHLLNPDEILPSDPINIDGEILQMDVVEIGVVRTYACNPECYSWQTTSPPNRQYIRPIQGGISMTTRSNLGSVGTLGFVAVDTQTQSLVGVTNNHVAIRDASITSQRNLSGPIQNEFDITDGGVVNPDSAYQSGEFINPPNSYIIGQVVRYVPISITGGPIQNKVDGALISLSGTPILSLTQSYKQYGLSSVLVPTPFATGTELDDLLDLNPLVKSSGRTTGVKDGGLCPLRIAYINTTVNVSGYNFQGVESTVVFNECFIFVRPVNDPDISTICINPSFAGDSGSAIIGEFTGTGINKIIGLNFAGSDYYGIANRIDNVANELGIEYWDGSLKNLVDTSTVVFKTIPGGTTNKIVNCGGENYWQMGLTTLNSPCA